VSDSGAAVVERDVKNVLRLIVRWHCRLSHVAAHTALMSVDVRDVILDAGRVVKELFDLESNFENRVQDVSRGSDSPNTIK